MALLSCLPDAPRPPRDRWPRPRAGAFLAVMATVTGGSSGVDLTVAETAADTAEACKAHALSAALMRPLNDLSVLPETASRRCFGMDQKNMRFRMSSTPALASNWRSSSAYLAGRSSPRSDAASRASSFCSRLGSKVPHKTDRISDYGSLPRGLARNADSFRRVSASNFDTTCQNFVSLAVMPRRWKLASAR